MCQKLLLPTPCWMAVFRPTVVHAGGSENIFRHHRESHQALQITRDAAHHTFAGALTHQKQNRFRSFSMHMSKWGGRGRTERCRVLQAARSDVQGVSPPPNPATDRNADQKSADVTSHHQHGPVHEHTQLTGRERLPGFVQGQRLGDDDGDTVGRGCQIGKVDRDIVVAQ